MGIGIKQPPLEPNNDPHRVKPFLEAISEQKHGSFFVGGTEVHLKDAFCQTALRDGKLVILITSFKDTVSYRASNSHDIFFVGKKITSMADGITLFNETTLDPLPKNNPLMFMAEDEFETIGIYKEGIKYEMKLEKDKRIKLLIRSWIVQNMVTKQHIATDETENSRGFQATELYTVKTGTQKLISVDDIKEVYIVKAQDMSFDDF